MHRILTDQDFDEDIVRGLARRCPVDWSPVRAFGHGESDDSVILELARTEARILLTHDARTLYPLVYELRAAGREIPKVVLVPQSMPLHAAIETLLIVLEASTEQDWDNPIRLPF